MLFLRRTFTLLVALVLQPGRAFAVYAPERLPVTIGTEYSIGQIAQNIVDFLAASITTVASAMFLVGAFMIVLAGAKEDYKQKGKDLMLGSIFSAVVVLGAYAIYRTVAYFLDLHIT